MNSLRNALTVVALVAASTVAFLWVIAADLNMSASLAPRKL